MNYLVIYKDGHMENFFSAAFPELNWKEIVMVMVMDNVGYAE